MKAKWIVGSFLLCLILGCTESPTKNQEKEKQGFSLSAFFNGDISDSLLYIIINFDGIQYEFPRISINNQLIDSGYYPDYFTHKIPHFVGNGFSYSIDYNDDRIADSIILPCRIDSLYCNGQFLKDTINVTIDSSSTYTFSWKKVNNAILYSKQIWSIISEDILNISSDTMITLYPNREPPQYSSVYGSLYFCGISYPEIHLHSRPNKESEKLFVYYDGIRGPHREVNFTIQ